MSRTAPQDLMDKETRIVLHQRSDWRPILHTIVILSGYAALSAVATGPFPTEVRSLATLCLGILFVGWFSAVHECVHGLFLRNRIANHAFGLFWACPTLLNFSLYKYYHLEHHRHTAVDGDPEPRGEYKSFAQYLLALPTIWLPVRFLALAVDAVRGRFPAYVRRPEHRRAILFDDIILAVWLILVSAATMVAPEPMLWAYWVPLAIYFPMLTITGLPEHYGCESTSEVWRNTRSTKSNLIFRFIYWNNNYHAEHHALPQVPYYNLPRVHAIIGGQFKHQVQSFAGFHLRLVRKLLRTSSESTS